MKTAHEFTYTNRQLSLRDELVLKSIVRILHGQTQHVWHYDPSPQADLLLVGGQTTLHEPIAETGFLNHPLTVHVGGDSAGTRHLSLPLRVGDVLVELNHAGDVLVHLRDKVDQHAAGASQAVVEAAFTLRRWPAWNLLQQDSRYLRVATVLATGPSTLSGLSAKSAVPHDVCDRLIKLLSTEGLIETVTGTKALSTNGANPLSDLSRAAARPEPSTASPLPPQKDASTLWFRIRQRLGLNTAQASR